MIIEKEFFFDLRPGVFWLDSGERGEGLNLADFGADQYGNAFSVETGMVLPFKARVRPGLIRCGSISFC